MAQPIRKNIKTKKTTKKPAGKKTHPKYGVSKLEDYFASNFLDVIGVRYIRQYEAKDIGRFYDFYCPDANIIIEVDGDFYHGYGLLHEQKSPMQKHNEWVDRIKDAWALERGIPILRIWEHDIHDNPEKVMKVLKESIGKYTEKVRKKNDKSKRH